MSAETDNDPVLTSEEKDALLEGVESGEVEVQSTGGPRYATVAEFELTPRNRIVSNSFPRLQNMNRKLAGHIAKAGSILLNDKVEAAAGPLTTSTWGEFCEQSSEVALIFEFAPLPLEGNAVIHIQESVVSYIVENFYGGSKANPPRHKTEGFTPGEMNVIALFCNEILKGISQTWSGLIELAPEKRAVHQSTDIVDIVENGASVIVTEFQVHMDGEQFNLHLTWPFATLTTILPVLEGQKRDRDPVEDARWASVIRSLLPAAVVNINTQIGNATLSLREVAELEAGDIIDIDNPRKGTVFADRVPVLEGRFGMHDGCYAIETTGWLTNGQAATANSH
jgi:flagellar motor switch protein FliM